MSLHHYILMGALAGAVFSCGEPARPEAATPPPADYVGMVHIDAPGGGFYIDPTEVTTDEFRQFIEATGYLTEADSFGWSGVWSTEQQNWLPVTKANWEYPLGPQGEPAAPDAPVTQVSYKDASAYAAWAGKRLPTEEEWLWAASQGGKYLHYPWGEELLPGGDYRGNWWQGPFPIHDEVRDGFPGVAAVKSFPASENGLYDMSGNVWEWTATERPATGEAVIKGGSFLCSTSYCTGFDLQQRQYTAKDSGLNHLGFRCIAG